MRLSADCPRPTESDRCLRHLAASPLMPSPSAPRARISTRALPSGPKLRAGSPSSTPRPEHLPPRQLQAEVAASLTRLQRRLRQSRFRFAASPSARAGLVQPFQHLVVRLLRAELPGKTLGIEERPQTRNNGAL